MPLESTISVELASVPERTIDAERAIADERTNIVERATMNESTRRTERIVGRRPLAQAREAGPTVDPTRRGRCMTAIAAGAPVLSRCAPASHDTLGVTK